MLNPNSGIKNRNAKNALFLLCVCICVTFVCSFLNVWILLYILYLLIFVFVVVVACIGIMNDFSLCTCRKSACYIVGADSHPTIHRHPYLIAVFRFGCMITFMSDGNSTSRTSIHLAYQSRMPANCSVCFLSSNFCQLGFNHKPKARWQRTHRHTIHLCQCINEKFHSNVHPYFSLSMHTHKHRNNDWKVDFSPFFKSPRYLYVIIIMMMVMLMMSAHSLTSTSINRYCARMQAHFDTHI